MSFVASDGVAVLTRLTPVTSPRSRAVVIGAGVVGSCTAYALARRGMDVTIIDSNAGPAQATSFANGAQLSYVYTDAMGCPALLRKMPGLAAGLDPAFRMKLHFDMDQMRWLLRFLGECSSSAFSANTLAGLRLGLESRAALHALLERHPIDFAHSAPGKLHVYDQADALARGRALAEVKRRHGAEQRTLTPAETVAIEPALAAREASMAGAIYSPQEEVGDPHRFSIGLIEHLTDAYCVKTLFGARVASVEEDACEALVKLEDGDILTAHQVVVCTATPSVAPVRSRLAGWVQPMKGYSFTGPQTHATPRTSITDVSRKLVFAALGNEVRVAGLAQLGFRTVEVETASIDQLVRSARAALPEAVDYDRIGKFWAGLRPMTPNSLPIIERISARISVNLGHGMLGWTYAMGSADRVAAIATADVPA